MASDTPARGGLRCDYCPARNTQNAADIKIKSNLKTILTAITNYASDHSGALPGNLASLAQNTDYTIASGGGNADICSDLVPLYLARFPVNPVTVPAAGVKAGAPINPVGSTAPTCSQYTTGYRIHIDTNNRLILKATGQQTANIEVTR